MIPRWLQDEFKMIQRRFKDDSKIIKRRSGQRKSFVFGITIFILNVNQMFEQFRKLTHDKADINIYKNSQIIIITFLKGCVSI